MKQFVSNSIYPLILHQQKLEKLAANVVKKYQAMTS